MVFYWDCPVALSLSFSVNENSSAKSKKGVALMSDYICLQNMKKGTLFHQLALVATSHIFKLVSEWKKRD